MGDQFPLTTHVAKHTFAVSKLNAGISSESIMKTMGIKKRCTFAIYGKITDEKVNDELRKL
jgi:site-specific recombinase XerD